MSTENEKSSVTKIRIKRSITREEHYAMKTSEAVIKLLHTLEKHMHTFQEGLASDDQDMLEHALEGYIDDAETLDELIEWIRLRFGDHRDLAASKKPYWIG